MDNTACYDVAIIGAGPAGISAAITATIRNLSVILFGQRGGSAKTHQAERILNYPGFPAINGIDLAEKFQAHLDALDINVTQRQVQAVYAMGDYFTLMVENNTINARAVILASGVSFGKPYPGEEALMGKGVSTCATCDGALYKGKRVLVIGQTKEEEAEAEFLADLASEVIYFPLYQGEINIKNIIVRHEKPIKLEGDTYFQRLITDKGTYEADGIFLLRQSMPPAQLVPGLKTEGGSVPVDRKMETNIHGLYASGDITGMPYQYAKSVGEGNVAALSAASYIAQLKKKNK